VRQSTITTGVLVTWLLWSFVTEFALAGWLVWALGGSNMLAGLLGLTAASIVGPATVAHLRLYACRLAFVVRAEAAAQPPSGMRAV
jgi:hypothetical protein